MPGLQTSHHVRDGYRAVGTYAARNRTGLSVNSQFSSWGYFSQESEDPGAGCEGISSSILFWAVLAILFLACFPSSAAAADTGNFALLCTNGAVAQIRSDGTLEIVDQTKLELEKERAKVVLMQSKKSGSTEEHQVSQWQLKHLQRKIRATQKQKGRCNDIPRQ